MSCRYYVRCLLLLYEKHLLVLIRQKTMSEHLLDANMKLKLWQKIHVTVISDVSTIDSRSTR